MKRKVSFTIHLSLALFLFLPSFGPSGALIGQSDSLVSASSRTSPTDSGAIIQPGDSVFDASRLETDTARFSLVVWRGESRTVVGQLTDILRRDSTANRVLLMRTQTLRRNGSQLVDSTVTDGYTLVPYQHSALQVSRMFNIRFQHRRVRGSLGPIDAPPIPIDTTLPSAAFDASNWDLLVRALPLTKGYAARFPVFDPDAGLRTYGIRVTGSAIVQGEDSHVVVLTLAKGRESVAWIGKESGKLLRVQTLINSNMMLEQERVRSMR